MFVPLKRVATQVAVLREQEAHLLFSGDGKEEIRERLRALLTEPSVIEVIMDAYQALLDVKDAQLVESPSIEIKVYLDARALDTSMLEPEDQEHLKGYVFPLSLLLHHGGVVIDVPMSPAPTFREN